MNAEFVSSGVPVRILGRTAAPASLTLQLAMSGALLMAAAQFGIMREYPDVYGPPDAVALAAFGDAVIEQLADPAFAPSRRSSFALPGSRADDSTP